MDLSQYTLCIAASSFTLRADWCDSWFYASCVLLLLVQLDYNSNRSAGLVAWANSNGRIKKRDWLDRCPVRLSNCFLIWICSYTSHIPVSELLLYLISSIYSAIFIWPTLRSCETRVRDLGSNARLRRIWNHDRGILLYSLLKDYLYLSSLIYFSYFSNIWGCLDQVYCTIPKYAFVPKFMIGWLFLHCC